MALLGPRDDHRRAGRSLAPFGRPRRSPRRRGRRSRSRATRTPRHGGRRRRRPIRASSALADRAGSGRGSRRGSTRRGTTPPPSPPTPSPRPSRSRRGRPTRRRARVHPHAERHPETDREALAERAARRVDPRHRPSGAGCPSIGRAEASEREQLVVDRSDRLQRGVESRCGVALRQDEPIVRRRPRVLHVGAQVVGEQHREQVRADIDDVGWPDPAAVVARMLSTAICAARSFQRSLRSSFVSRSLIAGAPRVLSFWRSDLRRRETSGTGSGARLGGTLDARTRRAEEEKRRTMTTFRDLGVSDAVVGALAERGIDGALPDPGHGPSRRDGRARRAREVADGLGQDARVRDPDRPAALARLPTPPALVMVPTRELAQQVADEFEGIARPAACDARSRTAARGSTIRARRPAKRTS